MLQIYKIQPIGGAYDVNTVFFYRCLLKIDYALSALKYYKEYLMEVWQ